MTEEFIEAPIEEEVNGVIIYTTDNYTPVFGTYYIGCDLTPPRVESILLTDPNGSTLSTDQYVQEVSPNIQVVSIGDQYSPPVGISICAQGPGSPTTYPDENEENDPGGNYLVASFYSEVSGEDWYESQ
ncbi:hypothetical protein H8D85_00955 [bacterium]|nr:hypothetical protein [bacterium]